MLKKIYEELVAIRKELQAIRSSLEFKELRTDSRELAKLLKKPLMVTSE